MGTQPLLKESTSVTRERVLASLPWEDFQGLVNSLLKPGQGQSYSYELPQDTLIVHECVEYKAVHEIPLFNNLREEFTEIFSSLTPVLKAKDLQLYQHFEHSERHITKSGRSVATGIRNYQKSSGLWCRDT